MKILQLVTKRQYRGAEVFAANLSAELIKLDHKIIFVGLYKNSDNILNVEGADNRDLIDVKSRFFSLLLLKELISLIREVKPDVVQCNGSDTLKYMYVVSYLIPKTPIVYRNISIISEWMGFGVKKKIYKSIFKRIDHVSSVGEEAIQDLVKLFNFPPDRTSVIRRGIPLIKVDKKMARRDLLEELNLDLTAQIVMHVGNFSPEKNHEFLLDLFGKIKLENLNVKLILVGEGVLFNDIKKDIKARNLDDTIFTLGFRKNIPELLGASDLFVLCSKVEGVPGVILEAGAQYVPSISTNVGGVLEVLKPGVTGFIINDFDMEEFKVKTLELLKDESFKNELGRNSFNLVANEFNPKKNALRFEELYKSLMKTE